MFNLLSIWESDSSIKPSLKPCQDSVIKYRKNCECCPVSLLIVRSYWWLSWIQVLNCLKCKKCKQFHASSNAMLCLCHGLCICICHCLCHCLSNCLFVGQVMSPHHSDHISQRSQVSDIALLLCSLDVFVIVIVIVFVIVNFDNSKNVWQFLNIFTISDNFFTVLPFFSFFFFYNFTFLRILPFFLYNSDEYTFLGQFLTILTIFDNRFYSFYNFDHNDKTQSLWLLIHWLQFWQLGTWIHDKLCYLTWQFRVTLDSICNSCDVKAVYHCNMRQLAV